MSKIALTPNANGSGVFTLASPNSNTNRTITLPDESVTLGAGTPSIDDNGNATAITIDSSENVGIGTSSPSNYNSAMNNLVIADSGDSGITVVSGTSSEGSIAFADGTSGQDAYRGWINYNHGANFMRFSTNGSQRMRIDSSGNVLVGKTSANTYNNTNGIELQNDGLLTATRAGIAQILNREDSDGDIAIFRKDGTSVGSIGVTAGDNLYFAGAAGNTKGLYLSDSGVIPCTTSGVPQDGTSDLGAPTVRFRHAYLSGGIYLGGAGSANALDDYEEGTWTPAVYQAGFTISNPTARYTKIGRLVTVTCDCDLSGTGNGNDMKISGLPFTSLSAGHASGAGYTQYYPSAQNGSNAAFIPKSGNNDTFVYFQNGNGARYDGDRFSAGFLNFTITYFTS
jgi:hypothetical protein